jgi:putative MATE family efflux protein
MRSSIVSRAVPFDRAILQGSILRAVIRIAWPAVLQSLFIGFHGIIAHALVGRFSDYTANAAIGVGSQVYLVVVVFLSSLYTGMSVLVSRAAGSGDTEAVNRIAYQTLLLSVGLATFVILPAGWYLTPNLLGLLNAAPEVRAQAVPYLRLMFAFGTGSMTVFVLGGALRAAGDPRTPLYLAIMVTGLTVGLDVVLIAGAGPIPPLGAVGAALGNGLAGLVTSAVALRLSVSGRLVLYFGPQMAWRPDWTTLRSLVRYGLPTGLQAIAVTGGGVLLVGFVGGVRDSAAAQAAYAVGYTQLFSLVTWPSLGLMSAALVVVGQNLGALQPARSARAIWIACGIGALVSSVTAALFLGLPEPLIRMFGLDDPRVLAIGRELLQYLAASSVLFAVGQICTGGLQGGGDTRTPLYIAVASQLVVPLVFCSAIAAARPLEPRDVWQALLAAHATRCVLSVAALARSEWYVAGPQHARQTSSFSS